MCYHRPQSLAWAVRKLSPGKGAAPSPPPVFTAEKTKNTVRSLEFAADGETDNNIISWADRVKGKTAAPTDTMTNVQADTPERANKVQCVVERNGFVAIREDNLKPEEVEEGWETVCYNKKNRTPEKCGGESSEAREISHDRVAVPKVKRLVTANGDVQLVSKRTNPEKDNGLIGEIGVSVVDQGSGVVECGKPVEKESDVSTHEQQALDGNKETIDAGKSSPIIRRESIEDEKFVDLNENRSMEDSSVDVEKSDKFETLKGFLSPLNVDSDVDTDNEDGLTASDVEHQKALSAAIEQEADLSKEYEKEREIFLASAIEHKEKLAKEIADQEAFVNAMKEEAEDDEEMAELADVNDESKGEKCDEEKNPQESSTKELTWEEMIAEYDEKNKREGSPSWGDIVEMSESRPPGRAVQMHKKLSSPSRKRDLTDGVKKQAEKQAKAQQLREQLLDDKLQHLQTLSEKVEKARELKMILIVEQELHLKEKQRRAEEKRKIKLNEKVRKAQEEEAKVNEIAFINTLEAQNKKMEVMSRHQDHEARLQDLQEERQRKRDEQQAKETAAYERRKQLEAERQARLEEMKQKRQDQEAKFLREKQEKEKAREEAAKEKAREREQRLAARNEALQTAAEQLQLKIKQKQQDSTKRHEQILELVKEKAAGASRHSTQDELPTVTPYERKKICTLCNVQIVSEVYLVSHLRGKKHQLALEETQKGKKTEDNETISLQYIKDIGLDRIDDNAKASEERKSAFKKRAKKIRTRMAARGREYEATLSSVSKPQESSKKSKLQKVIKDLDRYLKTQSTGPWAANRVAALERSLGELSRMLEGKVTADQVTFCYLGGLSTLSRILLLIEATSDTQKSFLPAKTLCNVISVMTLACAGCSENCWYLLLSNKLSTVVDLLAHQLSALCTSIAEKKNGEKDTNRSSDSFLVNLQRLLSTVVYNLVKQENKDITCSPAGLDQNVASQRVSDLVSYIVCSGIVDNLETCFNCIGGPNDNDQVTACFVTESLETLCSIARYYSFRLNDVFNDKRDDASQFMITVKHTGLVGVISLLYAVLLRDGLKVPSKIPEQLSDEMDTMATRGLRFLNFLATADLALVQSSLACEGVSLQFRHIVGHTLRICSTENNYELLHEVILIIGYFTVLNPDNQVFVQSGRPPTLLQKLCSLPFQYFSNPRLRNILFPTLICSCYQNEQNKDILEQEVSCALLNNYLEDQSLDFQQEKLSNNSQPSLDEMSRRILLSRRFPVKHWKEAQEFLQSPNKK
ncbi:S phase cyclin A-associated protein in the endoplasmic reticulum-like isoform X2 [Dendronephthya gigantea]|uniref:S phase cyclin A-associated protein in the endoplasmic reticulum-like isoform X2 n=1 Tax=Dendronephthya gigantea TaxID=151771 RepID=UPI00106AE14D|nr:S phase cyclin A-associated protein in the endoplasmic reticulum-like isoform X2 [Dendronephthya gigantea]